MLLAPAQPIGVRDARLVVVAVQIGALSSRPSSNTPVARRSASRSGSPHRCATKLRVGAMTTGTRRLG